jgi:hypothetical protein
VEKYGEDGLVFMNDIHNFLKKFAVIESEYAKGIEKLIQGHLEALQQKYPMNKSKSYVLRAT